MTVFGAEVLRLFLHVLDQNRTVDAFRETREVFYQGSNGELATGFVPFNYQGL